MDWCILAVLLNEDIDYAVDAEVINHLLSGPFEFGRAMLSMLTQWFVNITNDFTAVSNDFLAVPVILAIDKPFLINKISDTFP